jgi:choline dehydrogenase-like flavoprotein
MLTAGKVLPLQLFGTARVYTPGMNGHFWGKKHTEMMKDLRKRIMILVAMGYTEPTCRLELKRDGSMTILSDAKDHLRAFEKKGLRIMHEIIARSGGTPIPVRFMNGTGLPYEGLHFSSSHQLGSCRMAETPERGVAGPDGQVFGYPGMYITDGSAIPSSLIVNPSLTILANAERITDGVLKLAS